MEQQAIQQGKASASLRTCHFKFWLDLSKALMSRQKLDSQLQETRVVLNVRILHYNLSLSLILHIYL